MSSPQTPLSTTHLLLNTQGWNNRTQKHITSKFYDVKGFLKGQCSLNPLELAALGDVTDKKLLHLQCHFGLDTLSWARRGATVTGIDLSVTAIEQATSLARQAKLNAHFIADDIYHYFSQQQTSNINDEFDIVFTSYGVLCWLNDLNLWAQGIARCLKPNGIFYLAEFHPVFDLFSGEDYFHSPVAQIIKEHTYTENHDNDIDTLAVWSHSIADVINALANNGFIIQNMQESPYSPYCISHHLQQADNGQYIALNKGKKMPLIYSIFAQKK